MALDTMDKLVAALTSKQSQPWNKTGLVNTSGLYASLWTPAGAPGTGAAPTSAVVPTKATAGAFPFTNPGAGQKAYLAGLEGQGGSGASIIFYDRLSHQGGLSGTVTTAQTTNLPTAALTRGDTTGAGVEAWLEWYTATGSTGVTATISYTAQDGTAGRSGTVTLPASVPAGRMYPMTLQAGDTGVRSVESVTLSASTGTAGNFGVTLLRRLDSGYIAGPGGAFSKGPLDTRLSEIPADACIAMMNLGLGTNGTWMGTIDIGIG